MKNTTIAKLDLMVNAIIDGDCNRDNGQSFNELRDKSFDSFKAKLQKDRHPLNIGIQLYCKKIQIPWNKEYLLDNVCKTSRQINYLVNELKYYVSRKSSKNLETKMTQMEFNF